MTTEVDDAKIEKIVRASEQVPDEKAASTAKVEENPNFIAPKSNDPNIKVDPLVEKLRPLEVIIDATESEETDLIKTITGPIINVEIIKSNFGPQDIMLLGFKKKLDFSSPEEFVQAMVKLIDEYVDYYSALLITDEPIYSYDQRRMVQKPGVLGIEFDKIANETKNARLRESIVNMVNGLQGYQGTDALGQPIMYTRRVISYFDNLLEPLRIAIKEVYNSELILGTLLNEYLQSLSMTLSTDAGYLKPLLPSFVGESLVFRHAKGNLNYYYQMLMLNAPLRHSLVMMFNSMIDRIPISMSLAENYLALYNERMGFNRVRNDPMKKINDYLSVESGKKMYKLTALWAVAGSTFRNEYLFSAVKPKAHIDPWEFICAILCKLYSRNFYTDMTKASANKVIIRFTANLLIENGGARGIPTIMPNINAPDIDAPLDPAVHDYDQALIPPFGRDLNALLVYWGGTRARGKRVNYQQPQTAYFDNLTNQATRLPFDNYVGGQPIPEYGNIQLFTLIKNLMREFTTHLANTPRVFGITKTFAFLLDMMADTPSLLHELDSVSYEIGQSNFAMPYGTGRLILQAGLIVPSTDMQNPPVPVATVPSIDRWTGVGQTSYFVFGFDPFSMLSMLACYQRVRANPPILSLKHHVYCNGVARTLGEFAMRYQFLCRTIKPLSRNPHMLTRSVLKKQAVDYVLARCKEKYGLALKPFFDEPSANTMVIQVARQPVAVAAANLNMGALYFDKYSYYLDVLTLAVSQSPERFGCTFSLEYHGPGTNEPLYHEDNSIRLLNNVGAANYGMTAIIGVGIPRPVVASMLSGYFEYASSVVTYSRRAELKQYFDSGNVVTITGPFPLRYILNNDEKYEQPSPIVINTDDQAHFRDDYSVGKLEVRVYEKKGTQLNTRQNRVTFTESRFVPNVTGIALFLINDVAQITAGLTARIVTVGKKDLITIGINPDSYFSFRTT